MTLRRKPSPVNSTTSSPQPDSSFWSSYLQDSYVGRLLSNLIFLKERVFQEQQNTDRPRNCNKKRIGCRRTTSRPSLPQHSIRISTSSVSLASMCNYHVGRAAVLLNREFADGIQNASSNHKIISNTSTVTGLAQNPFNNRLSRNRTSKEILRSLSSPISLGYVIQSPSISRRAMHLNGRRRLVVHMKRKQRYNRKQRRVTVFKDDLNVVIPRSGSKAKKLYKNLKKEISEDMNSALVRDTPRYPEYFHGVNEKGMDGRERDSSESEEGEIKEDRLDTIRPLSGSPLQNTASQKQSEFSNDDGAILTAKKSPQRKIQRDAFSQKMKKKPMKAKKADVNNNNTSVEKHSPTKSSTAIHPPRQADGSLLDKSLVASDITMQKKKRGKKSRKKAAVKASEHKDYSIQTHLKVDGVYTLVDASHSQHQVDTFKVCTPNDSMKQTNNPNRRKFQSESKSIPLNDKKMAEIAQNIPYDMRFGNFYMKYDVDDNWDKSFKKHAKLNHPDKGGDVEEMKKLNTMNGMIKDANEKRILEHLSGKRSRDGRVPTNYSDL